MVYGKDNPQWSVMIPTYNCAKYLEQALLSVLQQDPGEVVMQIEVIDDCSTNDDPEEVVKRIGKGRVGFYRQPVNVGAPSNFNTCIKRAKGEYLHILHGDDFVVSTFYEEMNCLIAKNEQGIIFSSKVFLVNHIGKIFGESQSLFINNELKFLSDLFFGETPVQFAGVIFKRQTAIELGGFDINLAHINDRDFWFRLARNGTWIHTNKILAFYRVFDLNDSAILKKSGKNLQDLYKYWIKNSVYFQVNLDTIRSNIFKKFEKLISNSKDEKDKKEILKNAKKTLGNYIYYKLYVIKFIKRILN